MSEPKRIYWKGLPQLRKDAAYTAKANREFIEMEGDETLYHSRRDFLKTMGFSLAAASLAACETPIRKAIPYAIKPVDVDPGVPNYYASTYAEDGAYCSVLVKTREGRPIKVEGNKLSALTQGCTNAQVEASVMSLYDDYRLRGPKKGDADADWSTIDAEIVAKLRETAAAGKAIYLVSNTLLSPTTRLVFAAFKKAYPTVQHVEYDPISYCGIADANEASFGRRFIPLYDFSKAKIVVGINADFLGTWLSPIVFNRQYASRRSVSESQRDMSRHYQFESILSLTGANADYRSMIKPSQEGATVATLYNLLAAKAGRPTIAGGDALVEYLKKAADELWGHRGESLVVCGSNDKWTQTLINGVNDMLGSYGGAISSRQVNYLQGNDRLMASFVADAKAGAVGAVIFYGCNPAYDHPMGADLADALKNTPLTISTAYTENETSALSQYKTPDHHYLESWNDFEPSPGSFSLAQPAISPLFSTRQAQESLLLWAGAEGEKPDYFTFLKNNWEAGVYKAAKASMSFQQFWDQCLYDGVFELPGEAPELSFSGDVSAAAEAIRTNQPKASDFEVLLYETFALGSGAQANNPLLQELPDPITKAVWDHYATISQRDAAKLGVADDAEGKTQYLGVAMLGKTIKIPALVQPGQTPGVIGIPLGYGRVKVGRAGENIGLNVYPFVTMKDGTLNYSVASGVTVSRTDEPYQLAQTQIQHTYMARHSVIQEARLHEFENDPYAGREFPQISAWDEKVDPSSISLWKGHEYKDHHWGMAIDLNSCTGCGTCVVSCNVENNVAVVGKDEVVRRRDMHWLRIDRYYSSSAVDQTDYSQLEHAAENPEVVFQPMLCQQCNNAPCETVCPVAATTHSTEGLNQMAYNRCVGTRYCANNCPYKVRRFNWFKYHHNKKFAQVNPAMNTDLGRMALNPDVVVRSRGVMEKCSFCVQRIQAGKLKAKQARRPLRDGDVDVACEASCSTGAIVFGDMNDPNSRISQLLKIQPNEKSPYSPDKRVGNPRAYRVLEEIGVKPNVYYLTKIKNRDDRAI